MEFRLPPLGFMDFFEKNKNKHQAVNNESKIEKIVKNRSDFVGIFTYECKCVWVCASVCFGIAYYCVCGGGHIVYVYVKVQTQRVVFTGYKVVGVSLFLLHILFYFCINFVTFFYFCMCRWL